MPDVLSASRRFAAALTLVAACAAPALAADMIGNCELVGEKGQFSITPAVPGQLTVEVNLPAPGWWNGDTPATRSRTGSNTAWPPTSRTASALDKVGVVNVAWDALVAGQTRNYDLALSQASITDERKKVVDFSVPYFSSDIGVLVKKGKDARRDLDQGRSSSASSRRPPAQTFVENSSSRDGRSRCSPTRPRCSPRLQANQVDAALTDTVDRAAAGHHVGRQSGGGRPVRHRRDAMARSTRRARPTPATLDKVIQSLIDDGTVAKLVRQVSGRSLGRRSGRRSPTSSRERRARGGRPAGAAALGPQAAEHLRPRRPRGRAGRGGGLVLGRRRGSAARWRAAASARLGRRAALRLRRRDAPAPDSRLARLAVGRAAPRRRFPRDLVTARVATAAGETSSGVAIGYAAAALLVVVAAVFMIANDSGGGTHLLLPAADPRTRSG